MAHWLEHELSNLRIAALEVEHGYYLELDELFDLFDDVNQNYERIYDENWGLFEKSAGSSHNHQAWEGGYMDHLLEVLNIACQQYNWMSRARRMPFKLSDALQVLFLHDVEKPWKYATGHVDEHVQDEVAARQHYRSLPTKTKEERTAFRDAVIAHYKIALTEDQKNALKYVEGVRDTDYTPGARTMGELAAFCHSCDLLSARMWHDKGRDVNLGTSRWE
jgi:hypothetical protein